MDAGPLSQEEFKIIMENKKCKICRRLGVKLFLKGERCLSPKCSIIRRPYPPGEKPKKRRRGGSEYGKELSEKQKLKSWYNLREKQFSNYVKSILLKGGKKENTAELLVEKLESRLDNVVFRLGFCLSRKQAKQIVNHGHFLVNGRKVDIPSYQVKKGDVISVKPADKKKPFLKDIANILKKHQAPSWIEFNKEKLEAKIAGKPNLQEASPPAEISAIFEFYSK